MDVCCNCNDKIDLKNKNGAIYCTICCRKYCHEKYCRAICDDTDMRIEEKKNFTDRDGCYLCLFGKRPERHLQLHCNKWVVKMIDWSLPPEIRTSNIGTYYTEDEAYKHLNQSILRKLMNEWDFTRFRYYARIRQMISFAKNKVHIRDEYLYSRIFARELPDLIDERYRIEGNVKKILGYVC
jgi:hypothetical protein